MGNEQLIVIISRLGERLIVAVAGIFLIYIGYRLIVRRVAGATGSIDLEISKFFSAKLLKQGPGIYCVFFGIALLLVTTLNTITIDGPKIVLFERHDPRAMKEAEAMKVVQALQQVRYHCKDAQFAALNQICFSIDDLIARLVHEDLQSAFEKFKAQVPHQVVRDAPLSPEEEVYLMGKTTFAGVQ